MSTRINNLLTHISAKCGDSVEMQHVKQRLAQASLANQFILSDTHMKEMLMFMLHEMVEGLEGRTSTIRMLPSFVYKSNPSTSSGVFYALDLGGTNFRVLRVALRRGRVEERVDVKVQVPHRARTGDQSDLFGFMARHVRRLMEEHAPEDLQRRISIGFTFSFPCERTAINKGLLVAFGKNFTTKNVVGHDVVELLQLALHREALQAVVVALCNDTVGTLVAKYFEDENCQVGVIIGTGCNVSYFERSDAVTKRPDVAAHGASVWTAIDVNAGPFDFGGKLVLPVTGFDLEMDASVTTTRGICLEKLVSGMYLGEIARQVLLKLAQIGCLPADLATGLSKPWGFETRYMGMVCADQIPGLQFTRNLVKQVTGVDLQDAEDLHLFREVCRMVRNRSAQLSSVVTSAPILKNHTQGLASVAVDGSVYEKTPSFQRLYQESITRLLGKESNVRVSLQKDGSG
eukprot:gene12436-biopygen9141